MRWPRSELAAALACVALVAGCSTLPDTLEVAAGDLASSGATGQMAGEQLEDQNLTDTTARVIVDEAIKETASAMRMLVELPLTGERARLRDALLAEATELAGDLHDLSDAVSAGDRRRAAELARAIHERTTRVSDLETQVKAS